MKLITQKKIDHSEKSNHELRSLVSECSKGLTLIDIYYHLMIMNMKNIHNINEEKIYRNKIENEIYETINSIRNVKSMIKNIDHYKE